MESKIVYKFMESESYPMKNDYLCSGKISVNSFYHFMLQRNAFYWEYESGSI